MSAHRNFRYVQHLSTLAERDDIAWVDVPARLHPLDVMRCLALDGGYDAARMARGCRIAEVPETSDAGFVETDVVVLSLPTGRKGTACDYELTVAAPGRYPDGEQHGSLVVGCGLLSGPEGILETVAARFGGAFVRAGHAGDIQFPATPMPDDWLAEAEALMREGAAVRMSRAALGIMGEMGLETKEDFRRDQVLMEARQMVAGMPSLGGAWREAACLPSP